MLGHVLGRWFMSFVMLSVILKRVPCVVLPRLPYLLLSP